MHKDIERPIKPIRLIQEKLNRFLDTRKYERDKLAANEALLVQVKREKEQRASEDLYSTDGIRWDQIGENFLALQGTSWFEGGGLCTNILAVLSRRGGEISVELRRDNPNIDHGDRSFEVAYEGRRKTEFTLDEKGKLWEGLRPKKWDALPLPPTHYGILHVEQKSSISPALDIETTIRIDNQGMRAEQQGIIDHIQDNAGRRYHHSIRVALARY